LYTPRTLKLDLTRRGRLPFDECLDLALALTTALEHLHQNGLMHRDIKPANIIFVNGQPKLADIGLVVGIDATKSFVGTEGYIPPEGPTTPQADIYSLGKVLYEAATGRDRQDFPELPTNVVALPERTDLIELNEVILKACASDTKHRYQNATAMHADLLLLKTGKSVKHTRRLERRLTMVTRVGVVAAVSGALALAAFFYQKQQAGARSRFPGKNKGCDKKPIPNVSAPWPPKRPPKLKPARANKLPISSRTCFKALTRTWRWAVTRRC